MKKHGNAKFTDQEEHAIRSLYTSGIRQREVAQQFGVTQSCISKIVAPGARRCVDCHTPLSSAKKRCDGCRHEWQRKYFEHWYYDVTNRRGHQRRNRKRSHA